MRAHHPIIPSSHHPILQEHYDTKNVDGVFATSISVMEDAADALHAGLYFTRAEGPRVFTGEGAVEADFTLHAHGVTSGCSSKRYSLTIYNNIYTYVSAKLESLGAMRCNNNTEKCRMDALFERLRNA